MVTKNRFALYVCRIVLSVIVLYSTIYCSQDQTSNSVIKKECTSCLLQKGLLSTLGDIVASTSYFQARQDFAIPIPGFIIISSTGHIQAIDEFTAEERHDFIDFVARMRKQLREKLAITTIYMVQEEDASHFHLWLFPRYPWMEQFGYKVDSIKAIMQWAQEHLSGIELTQNVISSIEKIKSPPNQ